MLSVLLFAYLVSAALSYLWLEPTDWRGFALCFAPGFNTVVAVIAAVSVLLDEAWRRIPF